MCRFYVFLAVICWTYGVLGGKMWPITSSDINHDGKLPFKDAADLLKKNVMERLEWIRTNL